jgi:hypothetical protein
MSKMYDPDPCAEIGTCVVPPAEFVRLRYFFGQRLGVVDLADEQSYLVGKQHFHNLRAHGVGVLCGLRAERYVVPQGSGAGTPTTLLRVCRGAALDGCGREIIVGWDQCIDVAAWYAQHPAASGGGGPSFRLWVALCYRECPSDPAPAPRDPCGCDAGGCEFARIHEGFELKLLTGDEASLLAASSQGPEGIDLVAEETLDNPIETAYARLAAMLADADCTEPPAETCLLLASFQAMLDSGGQKVVDLTPPDNSIPARRSLLPTAILQQALLHALAAAGDAELFGSGPRFGAVSFTGTGSDAGTLSIAILPQDTALSGDPFSAKLLTVSVNRFQDNGTWAPAPSFNAAYAPGPPPHISLSWSSGLADGGRYRILVKSDETQPPVDSKMRPLTPLSWARHFRLVKGTTGTLVLANSLYS